ncbi:MAG: DUF4439 domain-containing protein [Streptosporangiales bacterium]|nr:DUF4439 domain-containing protein [Streptosporangiales bacterium]
MTQLEALQSALAAEHAAVYGYAVVGAHLSGADRALAARHLDEHRAARDELEAIIRERDGVPATALAGYELPFEVTGRSSARRLAARLERATTGAYAGLVGTSRDDVRRHAALAMQDCAVRQARWSGTVDPLPGLRT